MISTLVHWRDGVRLYIALAIALVTLEVWWWAKVSYGGTVLYATRIEEIFAWLALALLAITVSIGSIYKVWPKMPGKLIMLDARRLIGVGSAWFALLHATIVYVSLFKLANPLKLPSIYERAFLLGIIGLLILLAMAFTSFDRAMQKLGIWWFRLHRLAYVVLITSLLHAFMVGTQATHRLALPVLGVSALAVFGMQSYLAFAQHRQSSRWRFLAVAVSFVLLVLIFRYGYGRETDRTAGLLMWQAPL